MLSTLLSILSFNEHFIFLIVMLSIIGDFIGIFVNWWYAFFLLLKLFGFFCLLNFICIERMNVRIPFGFKSQFNSAFFLGVDMLILGVLYGICVIVYFDYYMTSQAVGLWLFWCL